MPVVQPYAISEPLSTAGLVNLNYQIAPFTYIERSTALRGVLKNVMLPAINASDVKGAGDHPTAIDGSDPQKYKFYLNTKNVTSGTLNQPSPYKYETRYGINRDLTVSGIDEHYFNQGLLFRYPSEVCNLFLVPQQLSGAAYNPNNPVMPTSYDNMMTWWNSMNLTGDNLREEPYDRIYPRLTTKSNNYTVHYRVQVLKKVPGTGTSVWVEGADIVAAEYRGSSLIERYIDPNNPALNSSWDTDTINLNLGGPNHADLSSLYKFRVVSTKKFAP